MNNLKKYRESCELTQEELGSKIGITRAYIASIENGRRNLTMKMAEALAPVLHCSPSQLLGGDAIKYDQSFKDTCRSVMDLFMDYYIGTKTSGEFTEDDKKTYAIMDALVNEKMSAEELDALLTTVKAMTATKGGNDER